MQYAFHFNVGRCAQCFACEVACKSAHNSRPSVQEEPAPAALGSGRSSN